MSYKLIHISPQDAPEIPIESTLFYRWLQGTTSQNQPNTELSPAIQSYLDLNLDKHRLTRIGVERLRDIFEAFWYSHYESLDSQEFIL
jgi:hypothetical protein